MKPSLFALLFLFVFIASSAKAVVVDIQGNYVVNGGKYYILPHLSTIRGGLKLAKTGNETIPLSVVQSIFPRDDLNGLPWTIRSPLRIGIIPTNTSLDFFSVEGKVPDSVPLPSKWTIVEGDDGIKSVKINGSVNTLKGWFNIQQYASWAYKTYKIVYCPINGESCGDLGISSDRRLVITDDHPFIVVFKREF